MLIEARQAAVMAMTELENPDPTNGSSDQRKKFKQD
jgi:hypothetical protein